jgi:tetratricopeptide (TPR) repeat protein
MKGIFLSCTGQKPLGYETVKRGVAKDSGSHIVWHVYALILRADKNFEEALKCYKKAVAIEPVRLLPLVLYRATRAHLSFPSAHRIPCPS